MRLEKLRRKLEQEVAHRERIREERDREERFREEKTRRELKRLEKLLAEAKSKIKDSSYSSPRATSSDRDRDDPLKLFSLKDLDAMTDESKFDNQESWMNPDMVKDYMDMSQQVFDFPMVPSNDRPRFLPKPSPPLPPFVPSSAPSNFLPNYARHMFNPSVSPSFGAPPRPRINPMHFGAHRPDYGAFSPSMSRFPPPPPPSHPMPHPPLPRGGIRIGGSASSLSSVASSMYPSIYGHTKRSKSEEKEERRPGKKIKSAIKDFAVSSIIDVGMMSLMNNLLGKINAEPGTGRRFLSHFS